MANEPARLPYHAEAVTPSDTAPVNALALYVGSSGNVAVHSEKAFEDQRVRGLNPAAVTFFNVPSGSILPVAVGRVLATGTTATQIVALK